MVTKIIATADIHIRNTKRMDEYQEKLETFIKKCKEIANENGPDKTRIVIVGDLFHNKLDISGEGYTMAAWLLRELDKIAKTIVIAGNHDMNMDNLSRLDPISALFSMQPFTKTYYLDREADYESRCIADDNIVWCLYSSFDSFNKPNIAETRLKNPDKTFIGLFHGDMKSARMTAVINLIRALIRHISTSLIVASWATFIRDNASSMKEHHLYIAVALSNRTTGRISRSTDSLCGMSRTLPMMMWTSRMINMGITTSLSRVLMTLITIRRR